MKISKELRTCNHARFRIQVYYQRNTFNHVRFAHVQIRSYTVVVLLPSHSFLADGTLLEHRGTLRIAWVPFMPESL